jgi:IS6 family transposase
VQTFTPEFIDAGRPARHSAGDRWFLDETYVKVAGRWTYLYRAVDQYGQVIDVVVSERRDAAAARAFFARALAFGLSPAEITTDRAPVYPRVIAELAPAAGHVLERYANNTVEADHGRLTARLRPMRGLKRSPRCAPSPPDTRSCRTCATDTTNTAATCPSRTASGSHLPTLRTAYSSWPPTQPACNTASDRSTQQHAWRRAVSLF